jgi:hypothetical protein
LPRAGRIVLTAPAGTCAVPHRRGNLALRTLRGVAPVTGRWRRKRIVVWRQAACRPRLFNAIRQWTGCAVRCGLRSRIKSNAVCMRSHGPGRILRPVTDCLHVLACARLRASALFSRPGWTAGSSPRKNPQLRGAANRSRQSRFSPDGQIIDAIERESAVILDDRTAPGGGVFCQSLRGAGEVALRQKSGRLPAAKARRACVAGWRQAYILLRRILLRSGS